MSDQASMDGRLTELEVKLAFVDETVHGLSSADVELSQRLAALERAVRDLRGDLASVRNGLTADPQAEPPPPHY
ncbi:MAG TPA: SlyX family protein [Luteibacter sp.]|nr:SlyX family protein [Luteibacter sp.]